MEKNDLTFGRHSVMESLKQGHGNKLYMQSDLKSDKLASFKEEARRQSVPVSFVPKQKLDQMTENGNHQGVVLTISPYQYYDLSQLIAESLVKKTDPVFLMLDGIEDPHNLGSMMRTADASGMDGIIIAKHRAVGITPIVAKTSTGAVEHVPVARVTNLTQAVKELKEKGFWVFGTDMTGMNYQDFDPKGPLVIVIGNEGKGMSPRLKKEMDGLLTIPMVGHVQSLNASVAAGLLMYEVLRKRQA